MEQSINEERPERAWNPIGSGGGDYEAIIFDGCLGFGLSLCNSIMVLLCVICRMGDVKQGGLAALLLAVVVTILLKIGQYNSDRLQTKTGKLVLLYAYLAAVVVSMVSVVCGSSVLAIAFDGAGLVFVIFLFGGFLASLERKALMIIFDFVFIVSGIVFMIVSQLGFSHLFLMMIIPTVLAAIVVILFFRKSYEYTSFVNIEESKQRSIKVKGNNHTLFLIGFMFSGATMAFFVDQPVDTVVFALGCSIGVAGVVSLLLERGKVNERVYKENLKKIQAFYAAALLLPLPLLPGVWRLVFLGIYTFMVSLNVIVLFNAILETSRFNMISPVWLLGQEGFVFGSGIFVGCVLYIVVGVFWGIGDQMRYLACVATVVICAWMQIAVNYQIYPFEPIIETTAEDDLKTKEISKFQGQRKALWQRKREYVADAYFLSPREREVFQLLLRGRDAKYIMNEFCISESTAKTHIYNIYRKMEIHSRQDLLDLVENVNLPDRNELDTENSDTPS